MSRIRIHLCLSMILMLLYLVFSLPADLVVDNDDGAPGFSSSGSWIKSTFTGYNGGTFLYASANTGSSAVWTPVLSNRGQYAVYAAILKGSNRTTSAPYTILHAEGESTVNIDQRGTPDQYFLVIEEYLGTWTFNAGNSGKVTLRTSSTTGAHIADAIIFRPLGDALPVISGLSRIPYYPASSEPATIRAHVTDDIELKSVNLHWQAQPSNESGIISMTDDGSGGDDTALDSIYAGIIPGFTEGERIEYNIHATDSTDQLSTSPLESYEIGVTPDFRLKLNELLASNVGGATDPDFNETGDWIEIINLGPDTADLGSFGLSDDPDNPARWVFPDTAVLHPGEYLVVWTDDRNVNALAMHTNFKLSADGESAILYDLRHDTVEDRVDFGPQAPNISLARIPDLAGPWIQTEKPTPGSANIYGISGPMPVISVPSGVYASSFQVEITTSPTAVIRYTLDGTAPHSGSSEYTGPVTINSTRPLRARAWYADMDPSPIASASYLINPPSDRLIPIMDMIIDPADFNGPNGIYTNPDERGIEWEKPVHVTAMSPDGSQVFEVETGVRMHGGYSRTSLAKKSFRFYFRSIYGQDRWTLPWLEKTPVKGVQQLVLRSNANDSFLSPVAQSEQVTFFRDQILRDWFHGLGHRASDGFFVALYINGQYWGLYNACERITDTFMEDTYDGGDWDVVKGSWDSINKYFTEAVDGDLAAWNEFGAWFENHDVSGDADFEALKTRLDYYNYLDFFILNIFCQNEDWPHNNWIAARRKSDPPSLWTFHEWDAEWSLGLRPTGWQSDTLLWARGENYYLQRQYTMPPLCLIFDGNDIDPNATTPINGILDHPHGERDFISRMEDIMNFNLHPSRSIPDVDYYVSMIQTEVNREADRWASSAGVSAATLVARWNNGVTNMRAFLNNRAAFMRGLIKDEFGLTGTRTITFTAAGGGNGRLLIRGRTVDLPWTGFFFGGSELSLRPFPAIGSRFQSWGGLVSSTDPLLVHTVESGTPAEIVLNFVPYTQTLKPNDVIFNEYWINDDGTSYTSIEDRPIDGDWIELLVVRDLVDLRGWRVTNSPTLASDVSDTSTGSIIFPNIPELMDIPQGTVILIITRNNDDNDRAFPEDELDSRSGRLVFYEGNGNLDVRTDPGFSIRTSNEALILLAPGDTADTGDDIGIDFIAEGNAVTPESFGISAQGVVFINSFDGIGKNDGAVFLNDQSGGFNNDDGADLNRSDFFPGPGGWIVDPPKQYTGDDHGNPNAVNYLTPGAHNHGQQTNVFYKRHSWLLY